MVNVIIGFRLVGAGLLSVSWPIGVRLVVFPVFSGVAGAQGIFGSFSTL